MLSFPCIFERSLQGVPEWIRVDQLGYCNDPCHNCWNLKDGGERGGETHRGEKGIYLKGIASEEKRKYQGFWLHNWINDDTIP